MEEDVVDEEVILYDLLSAYEWPESISIEATNASPSLWKFLAVLLKGSSHFVFQKVLHPFRSVSGPTASVIEVISAKLPWNLAITKDGTTLAVLRDDCIEIRKTEDDFQSVTFVFEVERSGWPQWRKAVWDRDGVILAAESGYGSVTVVSVLEGQQLCILPSQVVGPTHEATIPPHAVCGMAFLPSEHLGQTSRYPLIAVLQYDGLMNTFMIRLASEGPPVLLHTFSFADCYCYGVGAMVWHYRLNVLILAGPTQKNEEEPHVSLWRPLDSVPYWHKAETQKKQQSSKWIKSSRNSEKTMVLSMCLSPSGSMLATVDVSGHICILELPSCRLKKSWTAHDSVMSYSTTTAKGLAS